MSEAHHHFSMLELDCEDVALMSAFWAGVLGVPVDTGASDDYAQLSPPEPAPKWLFIRRPASGRGGTTIALTSYDLEASTEEAVAAGATALGLQSLGEFRWSELSDPEGNRFTFNAPPPR